MRNLAVPEFQKNDYGTGLLNSYSALADLIAEEYEVTRKTLNINLSDFGKR